jgi:beta-lactamase class A
VGKVLLLAEAARQFESGDLDPAEPLARDPAVAVADSGLWQHLAVPVLPAADVCLLIAAVSDNWATNVLLGRIGLPRVAALTQRLGLVHTRLHDRVRDRRGPADPPTLSTGTAGELVAVMGAIQCGELISAGVSARLDAWLATNCDLSMVAAGRYQDPLAHTGRLRNKTGTDAGVRADAGYTRAPYAVIANWDPAAGDRTAEVLDAMRTIGAELP